MRVQTLRRTMTGKVGVIRDDAFAALGARHDCEPGAKRRL